MTLTFRSRTFLSVFIAASIALAVSTLLVERSLRGFMEADIERSLLMQARLGGALLSHHPGALPDPDAEADALGARIGSRVTLIAADGRVLGDSEVAQSDLSGLENHATREEVLQAAKTGEGTAVRLSHTTGVETRYTAVTVTEGPVAYFRVALPLTAIDARLSSVRRLALIGLAAGLVAALVLTGIASVLLNRRITAVAETARRYRSGDFSRPARITAPTKSAWSPTCSMTPRVNSAAD